MALTTWYRGIWFMKDRVGLYLKSIFYANRKGALLFTDGTREIKFSLSDEDRARGETVGMPYVYHRASWDFRKLPAVLIGKATGKIDFKSFTKDNLDENVVGNTIQHWVGGDIDITLTLSVRATTMDERDNLVDITSIYLAHPDAKDYFTNHYITMPKGPTISSESEIREPTIDHPIYETSLSLPLIGRWEERQDTIVHRLIDVVAEVEPYIDLDSNAGRTVLDGS